MVWWTTYVAGNIISIYVCVAITEPQPHNPWAWLFMVTYILGMSYLFKIRYKDR